MPPRLTDMALKRLRDASEEERKVGDPKVATALEALLDWYDNAGRTTVGRRYRHLKRGTLYTAIGDAELQSARRLDEGVILRVYRGDDGRLWARPADEFLDGRFEEVTEQLALPSDGTCHRCGAAPRTASGLCNTCLDEDAERASRRSPNAAAGW